MTPGTIVDVVTSDVRCDTNHHSEESKLQRCLWGIDLDGKRISQQFAPHL